MRLVHERAGHKQSAGGPAISFAELGKIAYANQAQLPAGFEPGSAGDLLPQPSAR